MNAVNSRVTCICAKVVGEKGFDNCFRFAGDDEVLMISEFLQWLYSFDKKFTLLVSVNGRRFDIPFIKKRCEILQKVVVTPVALDKFQHFDLCTDICDKWLGLNNLARIYCVGLEKNGDGLRALELASAKRFEELQDYCWRDILLTEKVYRKYKMLRLQLVTEGFK